MKLIIFSDPYALFNYCIKYVGCEKEIASVKYQIGTELTLQGKDDQDDERQWILSEQDDVAPFQSFSTHACSCDEAYACLVEGDWLHWCF